jgi:hypothetical protein
MNQTHDQIDQKPKMLKPRWGALLGFILLCILCRLFPYMLGNVEPGKTYPWNFSPFMPMCLFGAAYISQRSWSYAVPLIAWAIGDIGIGLITGNWENAFYPGQHMVYLSFICVISLGFLLRRKRSLPRVAGTAVLSATVFFVLSNFGTWAFCGFYAQTLDGLKLCYTMAIPFYRNSLISMAVFCPVLFSKFSLVDVKDHSEKPALAPVA